MRRTAAFLAAVLLLSEMPVQGVFAAQPGAAVTQAETVSVDTDKKETGNEAETRAETVTETEAESERETESAKAGETESTAENEDEAANVIETETETETEIENETETEAESETEMGEETETETEIETETETETEIETEAETETETETESEEELDYVLGRKMTEEEIAAQKAMEPSYLPQMEKIDLPGKSLPKMLNQISVYAVSDTKYDGREQGFLSDVRNQNPWGTCWAFATMGILESALVIEGETAQNGIDLSERHLAYFVGHTGNDVLGNANGDTTVTPGATDYLDRGGNIYYAAMKLMNWQGAAAESAYPYINGDTVADLDSSVAQDNIVHMENCYWIETEANDAATIQAVKQMISDYGCVSWSYGHADQYCNYQTAAYYNYEQAGTNHAIMVVGWDDNYSLTNFGSASVSASRPTKNGAWIVRNSWGSSWGEEGYFYISYEDVSLGCGNGAAAVTANMADDYDNNYFYGNTTYLGWQGGRKFAQVFQVKGLEAELEKISAVSFMVDGFGQGYSIQLYKNPDMVEGVVQNPESGTALLQTPVEGIITYGGVYSVEIPENVTVSMDDYVAVVITFTDTEYIYTDGSEVDGSGWQYTNVTAPGQSFFAYSSSSGWTDLHQVGTSLRVNMLTANISSEAEGVEISGITVEEPQAFGGTVTHQIRWNKCSNVSGYEIYQSESEMGNYEKVGSVSATKRVFFCSIEKENWNTKYFYKVKAILNDGAFAESQPVSAQAEGEVKTGLNSAQCVDTSVTLKWRAIVDADGYYLERKGQEETDWERIATIEEATEDSYIDDISALPLGVYEYRLQAYKAGVTASWSEVKSAARSLEVIPQTSTEVKFKWLPTDGVSYYYVYVENSESVPEGTITYTRGCWVSGRKTESILDISGYGAFAVGEPQKSYVKAYDASGNLLSTTQKVSYHTVPDSLLLSAEFEDKTTHFSWTGGKGSDAVYIFRSREADRHGETPYATVSGATEYTDSTYPDFGTYYYWVYPGVTNTLGETIYGNPSTYQVEIAVTPVTVTGVTQESSKALKIAWSPLAAAESYRVYRSTEETGGYELVADSLAADISEYTDTSVVTGKTYYYKVSYTFDGKDSGIENVIAKKGQTVPDAPQVKTCTYNSVEITSDVDWEYAISGEKCTTDSRREELSYRDGVAEGILFGELEAEKTYYIYVRTKQEVTGEIPVYGAVLETKTAEYPIVMEDRLSPVKAEQMLESYALNPDGSCLLQIQNQIGEVQDSSMFTFTSEREEVCLVDAQGRVTSNPAFGATKDTRVKITAKATDDPAKREVEFYVTILVKKQIAEIQFEQIVEENGNTTILSVDNNFYGQKFVKGQVLTFKAVAYDASGSVIENPNILWTNSDTTIASHRVEDDNRVAVTLKKAGRVNLRCQAKEGVKTEATLQIGALDTTPLVSAEQVVLNKKSEVIMLGGEETRATASFTIQAKNGATAGVPVIAQVKKGNKVLTEEEGAGLFHVVTNGDGSYSVAVEQVGLSDDRIGRNNTIYTVVMETSLNGIPEIGVSDSITETFNMKVKLVSKEPSVTVKAASINRLYTQEEDLKGLLTVKAPDAVTNVRVLTEAEGQTTGFAKYFTARQDADGKWYFVFEDTDGEYARKKYTKMKGKVEITVNGYEPVVKTVTVKTPATLPKVKQQSVPSVYAGTGDDTVARVYLYNNSDKEVLQYFSIQNQSELNSDTKVPFIVEREADGRVALQLKENASYRDGGTLKVTLSVMELTEEGMEKWAQPLNVKVQVKVFKEKKPTVSMKNTTLTINRQTPGEMAKTAFGLNCQNIAIAETGQWEVYAYNSQTRQYDLQGSATDWLQLSFDEAAGELGVGFADGKLAEKGSYKFCIKGFAKGFASISKEFTVKVIEEAPQITVRTSGKLDLVKRSAVTLTGKLTKKNIPSDIRSVTVLNADGVGVNEHFYGELDSQKSFRILLTEAGMEAAMTTTTVVLPVEFTLENGQKIKSRIKFKPTQSKPAVGIPTAQKLYKSIAGLWAQYDLTAKVSTGAKIKRIEVVSVPAGMEVVVNDGVVSVKLDETGRGIKTGTYKVKVNVYFEGAQELRGYPDGKPVTKTIKVKVAE